MERKRFEVGLGVAASVAMALGFSATAGACEGTAYVPLPEAAFMKEEQEFPAAKDAPGERFIPSRHLPSNHSFQGFRR